LPTRPELHIEELASCHIDAQTVRRFELTNRRGMSVVLMEYGATLLSVCVPDSRGEQIQINLGLQDLQQYRNNPAYLGGTCGRFATTNDGNQHLHGGTQGFNKKLWRARMRSGDDLVAVCFEYTSADGEEGYPGELLCRVEYSLNDLSELAIRYEAEVKGGPTVVNLTNHSYWNLAGSGSVLGHCIEIPGSSIVAVDQELIPTGEIKPVAASAFDFTSPREIGERISEVALDSNDPTRVGYDHCYLVDANIGVRAISPVLAARLTDPVSGRSMEVLTDQPGLQFYTGVYLDGSQEVGGHQPYAGLCLECQQLPDAPNQPAFPSAVLNEGETYRQTTVHRFQY
jgi:aldose 1-epimerase